jgi:thiol-disulfide isomerase/thioredoxin
MHILNYTAKRFLQSITIILCLSYNGAFAVDNLSHKSSEEKGFFSLSLKSLQSPAMDEMSQFNHKTIIINFFEPECNWCYRQIIALEKLPESCNGVQVLLVGIHGNRQALQRELRRTKSTIPSYEASQALLALTDDIDATPITFIINTHGTITHKVRGYSPNLFTDNALCSQPITQLL